MNQGRFSPVAGSISAVPVLPANDSPWTVSPAAVPSWVTWVIIVVSSFAVSGETTFDCSLGSSSSIVRPSGSVAFWRKVGFISVPSLATAAATSAICIGVDEQPLLADRHPADVDRVVRVEQAAAVVDAARRHLVVGEVQLRVAEEPEPIHVLEHRLGAELLADLGEVGVDRVGEREVHVDVAEGSRRRRSRAARRRSRSRSGR